MVEAANWLRGREELHEQAAVCWYIAHSAYMVMTREALRLIGMMRGGRKNSRIDARILPSVLNKTSTCNINQYGNTQHAISEMQPSIAAISLTLK